GSTKVVSGERLGSSDVVAVPQPANINDGKQSGENPSRTPNRTVKARYATPHRATLEFLALISAASGIWIYSPQPSRRAAPSGSSQELASSRQKPTGGNTMHAISQPRHGRS